MRLVLKYKFAIPSFLAVTVLVAAACGSDATSTPAFITPSSAESETNKISDQASTATAPASGNASDTFTISLENQGGGMEGHTPRGFRGSGTGLFVGDNLNPSFPDGDGVQVFLSFDLEDVPSGQVVSAILHSSNGSANGMPLKDLGPLSAEEVRYSEFSPSLWDLTPSPGGASCVLADSAEGPFSCDVSTAVQKSLDNAYGWAQFRLRLRLAGDGDGSPDLLTFFKTDSNTNEPGIFQLEITIGPK